MKVAQWKKQRKLQLKPKGETDDSRKVRFAHVRETPIELRESSPILRESSEVNVIKTVSTASTRLVLAARPTLLR